MHFIVSLLLLASCAAGPAPRPGALLVISSLSLVGPVNDDSVEPLILAIQASRGQSLTLRFNTGGGEVNAGQRLALAIEAHGKVTCKVDGVAASMGLYLLQSCQVRIMTSRSVLMAHDGAATGLMSGQAQKWQNVANWLKAADEAAARHTCRRVTLPYEECRAHFSEGKEWWVASEEALRVGLVDLVIEA